MDPGGAGTNDDMVKVPVRGRELEDVGGPLGDETGQMVVEIAIVEVTTTVEWAGQFVTVGAQLVMVISVVLKTVEVVSEGTLLDAGIVLVCGVTTGLLFVVGPWSVLLVGDDTAEVADEVNDDGVDTTTLLVGIVTTLEELEVTGLLGVEAATLELVTSVVTWVVDRVLDDVLDGVLEELATGEDDITTLLVVTTEDED